MNHATYAPVAHRDGEFTFSHPTPEGWTPCSPLEDFALTFGTFLLAIAAPAAFVFMVLL